MDRARLESILQKPIGHLEEIHEVLWRWKAGHIIDQIQQKLSRLC